MTAQASRGRFTIPGGPPARYQECMGYQFYGRGYENSTAVSFATNETLNIEDHYVAIQDKIDTSQSCQNQITLPSIYGWGTLSVFGPQYAPTLRPRKQKRVYESMTESLVLQQDFKQKSREYLDESSVHVDGAASEIPRPQEETDSPWFFTGLDSVEPEPEGIAEDEGLFVSDEDGPSGPTAFPTLGWSFARLESAELEQESLSSGDELLATHEDRHWAPESSLNPGNASSSTSIPTHPIPSPSSYPSSTTKLPFVLHEKPAVKREVNASGSCVVCVEDFSGTRMPPKIISKNCNHTPSVCGDCVRTSIKTDLDSKLWSQIECPECGITLIYDDIRRLADEKTFARYENLSFRSAVGADANFVWCRNCDFGQLHTTGEQQPIITCLNCHFRTCFKHSVPWHDRPTRSECDKMLRDPDGFQSALGRRNESSVNLPPRMVLAEVEQYIPPQKRRGQFLKFLIGTLSLPRQAEEERQRRRHEEHLNRARREQEIEGRRMKEQLSAQEREAIKRRQKEEQMSLQTVKSKTRACPGCSWPIEKNGGCDHMHCTQCGLDFSWSRARAGNGSKFSILR